MADPFKTKKDEDEQEIVFGVEDDEDDVEEVSDEPIEPDEFLGADTSSDDEEEEELFTESDAKRTNPLYYAEYENQHNRVDRLKDPVGALEQIVKEISLQQETLAVSHHSLVLKNKEIGSQLSSILDTKKQTDNMLRKLEEFRRAEDLSDVDFQEIVNRVLTVVQEKGIGMASDNTSTQTPKNAPKNRTGMIAIIFSLIALISSLMVLMGGNVSLPKFEASSTQDQLKQTAFVPKGTKIKCSNSKEVFETQNDAKVDGLLRGNDFYYEDANKNTCWFKIK